MAGNTLTIGNSVPKGVWHLAALRMAGAADVAFKHISYKGAAPAVTDLLGGHIDAVTVSPAEVIQHVEVGDLRTLAVMAAERSDAMPDVPTLRERGIDVTFGAWRGLAAPAGTPDLIVDRLRDGFRTAFERPGFREAARKAQLGLSFLDGEAFTKALYEREQAADQLVGGAATTPKTTAEMLKGPALVPALAGGVLLVLLAVLALSSRSTPPADPEPAVDRRSGPSRAGSMSATVTWLVAATTLVPSKSQSPAR